MICVRLLWPIPKVASFAFSQHFILSLFPIVNLPWLACYTYVALPTENLNPNLAYHFKQEEDEEEEEKSSV